jgi:hypothetical protein
MALVVHSCIMRAEKGGLAIGFLSTGAFTTSAAADEEIG